MRKENPFISLALTLCIALLAALPVSAADYTFQGTPQAEYYAETETKLADYYSVPEMQYGITSLAQNAPMEKACYPQEKVMLLEDAENCRLFLMPKRRKQLKKRMSFRDL